MLVFLVFFSACSGLNPRPYETDFHTGTNGIVLEFLPNSPPDEVIEGSILPIFLSVSNIGAFSLNSSTPGVFSLSFTEAFLKKVPNSAPSDWNVLPSDGYFFGKSMFYPEGEIKYQLLPSLFADKLPGQITNPSVIISTSLCYPYRTILSDEFCIDTTPMTGDVRRTICKLEDKTYPQGQGGPVSVSSIKFEMQQYGLHMRPVLFIEIQNVGGGRVLAPSDFSMACQDQSSLSKRWNHVIVRAQLSGEELICVNGGLLDLNNGIIRCYMESGGFGAHLNYYANLQISIDYVYRSSISKEFEIYRIDAPDLSPLDDGCEYWEVRVGNTCMSRCEACASGGLSCGMAFPEVKGTSWACTAGTGLDGGGILNTHTFEPFFYSNSNCIQDPGFCAEGEICCARPDCVDILTCEDYKFDQEACNTDACERSLDCFWYDDLITGGRCKDCDPSNVDGCKIYSEEKTCKANPCDYEGGCKWDAAFFGSCKNKATECSDYTSVNNCIYDVDKVPESCVWKASDVCVDCPEPAKEADCQEGGDQTTCVSLKDCTWKDDHCVPLKIDNCALYDYKKSCKENPCGLASSKSSGCKWSGSLCSDPNVS